MNTKTAKGICDHKARLVTNWILETNDLAHCYGCGEFVKISELGYVPEWTDAEKKDTE